MYNKWARYSDNSYEVSTKGDKRFSAFNAKIRLLNNLSIEELYQVHIKGYNTIMEGKGNPTLNGQTPHELYEDYKKLWLIWADENPNLIKELSELAKDKVLTDMFATSDINQARVLSEILNDRFN